MPAAAARRGPGGRWLPALTSTRAAARAPVVAHRHRWALRHAMGGVPTALDCGRRSRRPSCVRSPGLPPTSHLPSTTRAAAAHAHAHPPASARARARLLAVLWSGWSPGVWGYGARVGYGAESAAERGDDDLELACAVSFLLTSLPSRFSRFVFINNRICRQANVCGAERLHK